MPDSLLNKKKKRLSKWARAVSPKSARELAELYRFQPGRWGCFQCSACFRMFPVEMIWKPLRSGGVSCAQPGIPSLCSKCKPNGQGEKK